MCPGHSIIGRGEFAIEFCRRFNIMCGCNGVAGKCSAKNLRLRKPKK